MLKAKFYPLFLVWAFLSNLQLNHHIFFLWSGYLKQVEAAQSSSSAAGTPKCFGRTASHFGETFPSWCSQSSQREHRLDKLTHFQLKSKSAVLPHSKVVLSGKVSDKIWSCHNLTHVHWIPEEMRFSLSNNTLTRAVGNRLSKIQIITHIITFDIFLLLLIDSRDTRSHFQADFLT